MFYISDKLTYMNIYIVYIGVYLEYLVLAYKEWSTLTVYFFLAISEHLANVFA